MGHSSAHMDRISRPVSSDCPNTFRGGSYTRLTNDLRELGLLSWIREKHYDRRAYTIHLPEHSQDSPKHYPGTKSELAKDGKNQYPDSPESVSRLVNETPNHYPDSSKSLSTMVRIPSFPTKERADKGIPTPEPNQKPETASLAPSAKIKTNFTGAGKENKPHLPSYGTDRRNTAGIVAMNSLLAWCAHHVGMCSSR